MHNSVFTDVEVIANNIKGLSQCYNKILRDDDIVNNYSVVLFVHDDVELEDINLKDKLINSPYDVTGLAGAKMFNKDVSKVSLASCCSKRNASWRSSSLS